MKKIPILFLLLVPLVCGIAPAQSFDLSTGRIPVASLDGLWRFHTGDDPGWAEPKFDDSQWALMRSDKDWGKQGYRGYSGLAWYRFQVSVPAGLDHISLYLPEILSSYEIFADGTRIGGYGKMPPDATREDGGGYFFAYPLPHVAVQPRKIQIALRVWHSDAWTREIGGGPQYGGGLVGDTTQIQYRLGLERSSQFWSFGSNEVLGLLEALAGFGTLMLFLLRRKESEYLWFSLVMFCSSGQEWVSVFGYTQVWSVVFWVFCFKTLGGLGDLALIAFYQKLLQPRRSWLFKLTIVSILVQIVLNDFAALHGFVLASQILLFAAPFDVIRSTWIASTVFKRARQNSIDARLLMAPVILTISANLLYDGAWMARFVGWHDITRYFRLTTYPFPIKVFEVTDSMFLLSVFGILVLRFARTSSEEEHYASEFESARSVQQYLIPDHLPDTPGLRIESEYRPAREVGGDFFQIIPDSQDGSALILVGDVAGHGLKAGMLSALIVGSIRTAVSFTSDPVRMMTTLNERLQGRGLVTCLALRIESDGSASLVNAGHLPPYLNGKELAIEGSLPLGAISGIDFPVLNFSLAEGDTLMLMTDGIAEAHNAEGDLFGFERIGEMIRTGQPASALANGAQAFGQEDDITVLTVRSVPA
jgi:hypothetical protein